MEKIIARELDKKGSQVVVKYTDSLTNSPVTPVFLRNLAELIDKGHTNSSMSGHNNCSAIFVEVDNKVVGHIVFDIIRNAKSAWIVLSGIDNSYRKRGLYSIMHKHFEKVISDLGCDKIQSHVHVNNTDRLASCNAVGMQPEFYRMVKHLPSKK
jgi:RimJ/RimL family protein N-acetyltransferase